MEIWRRRPDAQQLGKLWPPSQPADNFEPPACVRACVRARGAAEERPHKLAAAQATERTEKSDKHVRFHPLVSISGETGARVRKGRKKNTRWLHFSLLLPRFPPAGPTLGRAAETHKLYKLLHKPPQMRQKGGIQLVELALSLHIAAGECALKITWSFKWKKKRNPLAGEEFALKTDTSFSRSAILQPQGTKRVPAEGRAGGGQRYGCATTTHGSHYYHYHYYYYDYY